MKEYLVEILNKAKIKKEKLYFGFDLSPTSMDENETSNGLDYRCKWTYDVVMFILFFTH